MIVSDNQAKSLLQPLYHVAENDRNDVIANAASSIAVRLEKQQRTHRLTENDVMMVQYALKLFPESSRMVSFSPRRKTYKRNYNSF